MSPTEKWEQLEAQTGIDYFLRSLDADMERLKGEIEAMYPELGRESYRYRKNLANGLSGAWPVEEILMNIGVKDAEINRIRQLRDALIAELKKKADATA